MRKIGICWTAWRVQQIGLSLIVISWAWTFTSFLVFAKKKQTKKHPNSMTNLVHNED